MNPLKDLRIRLSAVRNAHEWHRRLSDKIPDRQIREPFEARWLVWIFGAGRSGTTWLRDMLADVGGVAIWDEPFVGRLFGTFSEAEKRKVGSRNYIFADAHRDAYLAGIRAMVLHGAASRFGENVRQLFIKEPNGSVGARLLSEALPESGIILVQRDPRDILASVMDGSREGGWQYERHIGLPWRESREADLDPLAHTRRRSIQYLNNMTGALQGYESHSGPKTRISYEDLRTATAESLVSALTALDIKFNPEKIESIACNHTFEAIPEEERGAGKFRRKAQPGAWREDLTPEQVAIVEEIAGPLMDRLGYERSV